MDKNDPLCLKVVEKFAEIFGTETGNLAVKTLPSGGIYLIGGVTAGMKKYLIENDTFMNAFYDKGRLADYMRTFPVHLVNPDIEVGLLGA
jgi:glucokinase